MNISTTNVTQPGPNGDLAVLTDLYHRFLTGLLLALASRAGVVRASDVVFRSFRRQQLQNFLPGLDKLGIRHLPPAVACAQYHYLSNALGGAKVEWIPETDRKSWVRYLPPRWIFDGTAVCGIPTEMSRAMLRGWHANNGVLLGNHRLGFVCTSLTTDGGAGAVGYYIEEDRDLLPDERLRFAPGERPPGPPVELPMTPWDPLRMAKLKRNYSMEYVRSLFVAMMEVLGPADAGSIGRIAARQIGMQFHDFICDRLGHAIRPTDAVKSFSELLVRLMRAHGDACTASEVATGAGYAVRQSGWRFGAGLNLPSEGFEAWTGLWEGVAAVHGAYAPFAVSVMHRIERGEAALEWRIG
jgi:hypothetical protein